MGRHRARAAAGDHRGHGRRTGVRRCPGPGARLRAWLDHPDDGFSALLVDPYTGTVTERRPGDEWLKSIEALHRNLLLGGVGRQVVAVSSIAMALVVVLGVVLWWPMRRGTFRRLTGKGGVLGWHNLLGLFAAPLLVLFALTGITLTYHGQIIPALYQLATGSGKPSEPTVAVGDERMPLERVFAAARGAFAGARVQGFSEPDTDAGAYRLRLRRADSVHPEGWLVVWVDPATGAVVGTRDTGSESWASWYDRFWFALHTGSFLPAGPRALWLLAAAGLPVLGVTGVWQWLRRRRRRGRTAAFASPLPQRS